MARLGIYIYMRREYEGISISSTAKYALQPCVKLVFKYDTDCTAEYF